MKCPKFWKLDLLLIHQNGGINKKGGDKKSKSYFVTLNRAKELCMIENNEIANIVRKYFSCFIQLIKGNNKIQSRCFPDIL